MGKARVELGYQQHFSELNIMGKAKKGLDLHSYLASDELVLLVAVTIHITLDIFCYTYSTGRAAQCFMVKSAW